MTEKMKTNERPFTGLDLLSLFYRDHCDFLMLSKAYRKSEMSRFKVHRVERVRVVRRDAIL